MATKKLILHSQSGDRIGLGETEQINQVKYFSVIAHSTWRSTTEHEKDEMKIESFHPHQYNVSV